MLKNYLNKQGKVIKLPKKLKDKIEILGFLSNEFDENTIYTEQKVNNLLNNKHTFNDSCIIRRELVERNFLGRSEDCKKYWKIKKKEIRDEDI